MIIINSKKEIILTVAYKVTRVKICKKWLMEGLASQNIIFTDEMHFSLDGPNYNMSWQQPGH
jgi:hypothetical protein